MGLEAGCPRHATHSSRSIPLLAGAKGRHTYPFCSGSSLPVRSTCGCYSSKHVRDQAEWMYACNGLISPLYNPCTHTSHGCSRSNFCRRCYGDVHLVQRPSTRPCCSRHALDVGIVNDPAAPAAPVFLAINLECSSRVRKDSRLRAVSCACVCTLAELRWRPGSFVPTDRPRTDDADCHRVTYNYSALMMLTSQSVRCMPKFVCFWDRPRSSSFVA